MDFLLLSLGLLLMFVGMAGSILPVLPGVPVSWLGILLLYLAPSIPFDWWVVGITGVVAIGIYILDYIIPSIGTKRFGVDGGEALIPALEQILKRGSQLGIREVVFGMPHRGRLNVLANVMSKPFQAIFSEFMGNPSKPDDVMGSGDVKYHLGTSADREFDGNVVHLSLTANPSHLEAVNTVVLGKVRAKQAPKVDRSAKGKAVRAEMAERKAAKK